MSEGHTVTLRTSDGEEREFTAAAGQSVVEATREAGTIIPSLCGHGSCGTCVGRITEGSYHVRPFEPDAIGPSAGDDAVLLCCCEPESDLLVELAYDSARLVDEAPAERRGTIQEIRHLSPHVVELVLQLAEDPALGSAAEFEAGQFMQLEVPGTDVLRAYSMSNVSNWDGRLEFLIHIREHGRFSGYLEQQAAVGDELRVVGPQGAFALEENGMRPRWFVGGGCGFAPLLSMLRRMAEWGDPQPAKLILGVNTPADVFADDAIREVSELLPQLEVTIAVWEEGAELPADRDNVRYVAGSSVDGLRRDLAEEPDEESVPDIYVCGPPGMVRALEEAVTQLGIEPERVHTERITEN